MNRRHFLALAITLVSLTGIVTAADNTDPTGKWKWTVEGPKGKMEMVGDLKLADGKLTGTITGRNNMKIDISDATFKDGEVAFTMVRERNGNNRTSKYKGKLDGDSIKGKIDAEVGGQSQSIDWEAKRDKS